MYYHVINKKTNEIIFSHPDRFCCWLYIAEENLNDTCTTKRGTDF